MKFSRMRFIPVFFLSFIFFACQEKNFEKSMEGSWELRLLKTDTLDLLNTVTPDTLVSDSCNSLSFSLNTSRNLVYEFQSKGKLSITENRFVEIADSANSLQSCNPIKISKESLIVRTGTWQTSGTGNILLVYGDTVDNIRVTERTDEMMIWEQDLNVNGGLVSFQGIKTYHLHRIK